MNDYEQKNEEEMLYLENTLDFINKELKKEQYDLNHRGQKLIESRREMWQESVHLSNDFDRVPEMVQYLSEVDSQSDNYEKTIKRIKKYTRIISSPYFGRFDFQENGLEDREKIYVGLYNLIDNETSSILVYDWRSPISSIFYQCEIGKGFYKSPDGIISGDISMKRQYKIQDSQLKYFFDSSIRINDDILVEVLGHNSSSEMKNIAETIQKEQDTIIRDTENELLIVQGVAGSGKTSIALHRIAFLLYIGMDSKLNSNNILIISPNSVFSEYISGVLPELGEENVLQTTFDDIAHNILMKGFKIEKRDQQLESLITSDNQQALNEKMEGVKFKGSEIFVQILDKLIKHYEDNLLGFEDVYYNGKIIETRQQIENQFIKNKGMPIAKILKKIEDMLLSEIHPLTNLRKEKKAFVEYLHRFTEVNYINLYKMIFNDENLLLKLSEGLELPDHIEKIVLATKESLDKGYIPYEDCAPILYIKLAFEGSKEFFNIKQVVIDEAQDYYALQYKVFKLLFSEARYTILGDFNQTIEKYGDKVLYDDIEKILHKRKSVKLFLNKSYRSSVEINTFTQKILDSKQEFIPFERHKSEPILVFKENLQLLNKTIAQDIQYYQNQGYESIAVICKTEKEAVEVQKKLKDLTNIKLLSIEDIDVIKGVLIIPSYKAKGLEFDVVLVYNASKDNYTSEFDRRLLYIACTRALHELSIYYTGEKSNLI